MGGRSSKRGTGSKLCLVYAVCLRKPRGLRLRSLPVLKRGRQATHPKITRPALEIIDLRHFTSADLRPLLEEEKEVWSHLLSWDYGPSADMILRYVDARILPGYAAVQRGLLHGYSF